MIAWLLACEKISPPLRDLSTLYEKYSEILRSRNASLLDPDQEVSTPELSAIDKDIYRTIDWFEKECENVSITSSALQDASKRVTRILSVLSVDPPYLQGYDRYVFICYGLILKVATDRNFGQDFAEAIAFFLTDGILRIADMRQFLNAEAVDEHFSQLDREIQEADPKLCGKFRAMGITSVHFALRWQLLLFADEHTFPETWLIWDAIIANQANASAFVKQLSVAHACQVQDEKFATVIEAMQRYREWNVPNLLQTAEKRVADVKKKQPFGNVHWYNRLVAFLVFLVFFWYLHGRFNKDN
jgi:hypothetical protein